MTQSMRFFLSIVLATASLASAMLAEHRRCSNRRALNADSRQALQTLYKAAPFAETISHNAKAIVVFRKSSRRALCLAAAMVKAHC